MPQVHAPVRPDRAVFRFRRNATRAELRRQAPRLVRRSALCGVVALLAAGTAPSAAADPVPLRVCAEPNNLPSSHRDGSGFENRIARLVADDLGRPLEFVWHPQWRAFTRKTLGAGKCDLLVGVPRGMPNVLTTQPYYRSSYVLVSRAGETLIDGIDDPRLLQMRVGLPLIANDVSATPPGLVLSERGARLVGFSVYGEEPAAAQAVTALVEGRLDVAALWGPQAGYFARRAGKALQLTPVKRAATHAAIAFDYEVAMAVRRDDAALRDRLDLFITARRQLIDAVLDEYAVPRAEASAREATAVTSAPRARASVERDATVQETRVSGQ
jgi:mxaJ protein